MPGHAGAPEKAVASMVKRIAVPPDRQGELASDFRKTNTRDMRLALREYLPDGTG